MKQSHNPVKPQISQENTAEGQATAISVQRAPAMAPAMVRNKASAKGIADNIGHRGRHDMATGTQRI